ncbi:MAG: bifunctional folylpolyglutamate synthase/dihydrofolate synthase [Nitrospirae bacterium]|nr:bifunctional folylpolyglutamate synthase/dihydrofolate synthase [Nitrospirota bacterium]
MKMQSNEEYYNESVNYLYGLQKHGIKLGLNNIRALMDVLGGPHRSFRSIHIAGTNGKGSTSAIIASILRESGYRVGLYTSPHLVSFTERIRINDRPISESDVIKLTAFIKQAVADAGLNPTFFEFVTAMAFHYFASQDVEWAVVETGMGGRLDATNVITPEVCVITNIGYDHKEFLGGNISDIAYEKAGILKKGVPLVTAVNNSEALGVIEETAKNIASDMHIYGRDFKGMLSYMDDKHIVFDYTGMSKNGICKEFKNLSLHLAGRFQICNASAAVRACEIIKRAGAAISDVAIVKKNKKLNLGGRLEWVSKSPPIIVDGAHNPEAAEALAQAVKELFTGHNKIILVTGIMKDKDIEGILRPLVLISDTVILTKPRGERAALPERMEEFLKIICKENNNFGLPPAGSVIKTNSVTEAIETAKKICGPGHIILVTGSFYTTGEVKETLGQKGVLSALRE